MALLLCLTTLTLSVGLSTAWAEELEPTDTYELTDDISLFAVGDDDYNSVETVFPMQAMEYLKGYLNNLPSNRHYYAVPQLQNVNAPRRRLVFIVFSFTDSDYYMDNGGNRFNLTASDTTNAYLITFEFSSSLTPESYAYSCRFLSPEFTQYVDTGSNHIVTYSGGFSETFTSPFQAFSDIGMPYSDILNRKGERVQYATLFSLVVFFVYDRLRALWRSIRGRDT